ncbi:unnamed protein product [Moneuplotes crassus]|uniref:Uncharacterized protein n=1 Tax=Euplotes crassus TaxID=5936 RepID=A0AAD1UKU6_EUPCR|nr:unnamed protein product [Moneuplotes crassus]
MDRVCPEVSSCLLNTLFVSLVKNFCQKRVLAPLCAWARLYCCIFRKSKWCCAREDKEISDFIIRPVLHKSPEIIVKLYKGTIKDDKNKKSNISEQYVSSVRNVPKNLKYLEETKKHPLHLTQPFMLKVVATSSQKAKFELNTSKKSKNNDPEKGNPKKIEDSWILLSVDPNDKEVYVKPMTCYYLTKIVNSKIRYLKRKSPHKLSKLRLGNLAADKEKAAKIEICIKRKDLHDTPDLAQRRVFDLSLNSLFDNKARCLSVKHYYPLTKTSQSLANDPVVAIKYDSYAKIPLQNYFTVKFSKSSGKSLISFETKLKFSEKKQYLGWTENKDKLERKVILVNEEYHFELKEVVKGEGGEHLLTNQQFLLKIPDTNYCLRSVSSSYKRMSDVKISEFDQKDAEEFYFHIQRMQCWNLSFSEISDIDDNIWKSRSRDFSSTSLEDAYLKKKEFLHKAYSILRSKQPNIKKDELQETMCLNGYFYINLIRFLHKVYDFNEDLNQLKSMRDELSEQKELKEIDAKFYYSPQIEYNLAIGLSQLPDDPCSILARIKEIPVKECYEDKIDYRRIMMLQKILALCQHIKRPNSRSRFAQ